MYTGNLENLFKKYLILLPLLLIQYPLWFGENGWVDVWSKEQNLRVLKKKLIDDKKKLALIKAEVRDFKDGYNSIEEIARYKLGMIKPDEKFLQILRPEKN
ncbi:MAG: hypothetical protein CBD16_03465 [Betaproteobacteria bacterium TMED156]|nr:MAG: hypothetical protein CBD16_03465 [Betaproteobacteria bacterium TMED156]